MQIGLPLFRRDLPHHPDQLRLLLMRAMRKIQPRHIQPRPHQLAKHLWRARHAGPSVATIFARRIGSMPQYMRASLRSVIGRHACVVPLLNHWPSRSRSGPTTAQVVTRQGHSTRAQHPSAIRHVLYPLRSTLHAAAACRAPQRAPELRIELRPAQHAQRNDVQPEQQRNARAQRPIHLRVVREPRHIPPKHQRRHKPHRRRHHRSRQRSGTHACRQSASPMCVHQRRHAPPLSEPATDAIQPHSHQRHPTDTGAPHRPRRSHAPASHIVMPAARTPPARSPP